MLLPPESYVLAMDVIIKKRRYEMYWNGTKPVPFLDQAKVYSRLEAQRLSSQLAYKGKKYFVKEIM